MFHRQPGGYSVWVILTVALAGLGFSLGVIFDGGLLNVFFALGALTTGVTFLRRDRDRWTAVAFLLPLFITSFILIYLLHFKLVM